MKRSIISLLALVFLITSCSQNEESQVVQESVPEEVSQEAQETQEAQTISQENTTSSWENNYTIIKSWQDVSYDDDGNILEWEDAKWHDAYYGWVAFSFTDNGDGTVTDNNTGLMWEQTPSNDKFSWDQAWEYAESFEWNGYDDWRLPTAKELFALSDFQTGWPYLDTDYFDFPEETQTGGGPGGWTEWSDKNASGIQSGWPQGTGSEEESTESETPAPPPASSEDGSVSKDAGQFWSSNFYHVWTANWWMPNAFGVNHATGHIKSYPSEVEGQMGKHIRLVRWDLYGENDFKDNKDGTITDNATWLMWMQDDSGVGVEWQSAINYCENLEYAWYSDFKLPNVKELHSLLDYSWVYPAIYQDYFNTSVLEENINYYFWTNTSGYFSTANPGYWFGWYVAFGKAVGNDGEDSHGAWAIRFSPKYKWSSFEGEWWDNMFNSVRCVRNI